MQKINNFISSKLDLPCSTNISEGILLEQLAANREKLQEIFFEIVHDQELLETVPLYFKVKLINLMDHSIKRPNQLKNAAHKLVSAAKDITPKNIRNTFLDLKTETVQVNFKKQNGSSHSREVSKYFLAFIDQKHLENISNPEGCCIILQDKIYDLFATDQKLTLADLSPIEIQELFTFAMAFEFDINKILDTVTDKDLTEENIRLFLESANASQHSKLSHCCFKFIKERSKIDLEFDGSNLKATITDFNDLESVQKYLNLLTSLQLTITMRPADGQKISNLEEFTTSFADRIVSLQLNAIGADIDELLIEKFTKNLINLTILDLSSCIALTAIDLCKLKNLTTLNLSGCQALEKIEGLGSLANLTSLDLSRGRALKTLPGLGDLANLITLDLSSSSGLTKLCELQKLTNLKELKLSGCYALTRIDVGKLANLITLDVSRCDSLTAIDELSNLTNLRSLNLSNLKFSQRILKAFNLGTLIRLVELDLSGCKALRMVIGLASLSQLEKLNLSGCIAIRAIDVGKLIKLTELNLSLCWELAEIKGLAKLNKLNKLNLSECDALIEADGINQLINLRELDRSRCTAFRAVDVSQLINLNKLNLSGCNALISVKLGDLTQLTELNFSYCNCLATVNLGELTNLSNLEFRYCKALQAIEGLDKLVNLTALDLSMCSAVEAVDVTKLTKLKTLTLSGCIAIRTLAIGNLSKLVTLNLAWCSNLEVLVGLSSLRELETIDLSGCKAIKALVGLNNLTKLKTFLLLGCFAIRAVEVENLVALETLDLSGCVSLEAIVGLSKLTKLKTLDLSGCSALRAINVANLMALEWLDLKECIALKEIVGLANLTKLETLNLSDCSALTAVTGLSNLANLETLDLTRCCGLDQFELLKSFILFMSNRNIINRKSYQEMFDLDHPMTGYIARTILEEINHPLRKKYLELLNIVNCETDFIDIFEFMCLLPSPNLKLQCISQVVNNVCDPENVKNAIQLFKKKYATEIGKFLGNPTIFQYVKAVKFKIKTPIILTVISFLEKYLSEKIEIDDRFVLQGAFQNYLYNPKNEEEIKKLFVNHRDKIHSECKTLRNFITQNFPESEHPALYPIKVFIQGLKLIVKLNRYHMQHSHGEIFSKLAECLNKSKICFISVRFTGESGIDTGALTREFFSQLLSDFVSNYKLTTEIPFFKNPHLKYFGAVLGLIHLLNTKISADSPIHTGCGMSEDVYLGMVQFSHEELQGDFKDISPMRQVEIYREFLNKSKERYQALGLEEMVDTRATWEKMICGLVDFINWDGTGPEELAKKHLSFLKNTIATLLIEDEWQTEFTSRKLSSELAETECDLIQKKLGHWKDSILRSVIECFSQQLENLHTIASHMNCEREIWDEIQMKGPENLQKDIEGNFSKDKFFDSFNFKPGLPDSLPAEFKEWSNSLSEAELKRVLAYSTGSPTIPEKKIVFECAPHGYLTIHACMHLVRVGLNDIEKIVEGFNEGNRKKWTAVGFIIQNLNEIAKGKEPMKFDYD